MLFNAFIIVWRESLEAMLVIGILAAWAEGRGSSVRVGLWSGVAAGVALALALSAMMQGVLGSLSDRGQEIFQAVLILVAAALMTHMVLWMRRHARGLRRAMEGALDRAAEQRGAWGIAAVAAVAVAIWLTVAARDTSDLADGAGTAAAGAGLYRPVIEVAAPIRVATVFRLAVSAAAATLMPVLNAPATP